MKRIEKYSLGMGDRFANQGRAQLQAVIAAKKRGITLSPVWNKSNREHNLIHSEPCRVRQSGLPETLKLSVQSGSDKFSLSPIINRLLKKHDAGVHIKTAGTTWLEEVVGLAESGGDGLEIAREIYAGARERFGELVTPYASVTEIRLERLPTIPEVRGWNSARFCAALRHDVSSPFYSPDFRQLIHVAFKIAAEIGARYTDALVANETIIARNVTANLLDRHILPFFS